MAEIIIVQTISEIHEARVLDSLRRQEIVCLPSDTCYGLSCLASSEQATQRLRRIKRRDISKAFVLIASDTSMAMRYTKVWTPEAQAVSKAFWPGPLTIVVPFGQSPKCRIDHHLSTIAIRVPGYPLLRNLVRKLDCPLWSTSVNDRNGKPAGRINGMHNELTLCADLILDAGQLPHPTPSTILDLSKQRPSIIRKGPVKAHEITQKTNIIL